MKTQTTQKYIKSSYKSIIQVGYSVLQNLLKYKQPWYYTAGTYGWNADVYVIKGVAIVTGYRPFGNIKASYDVCRKYDNDAEDINNQSLSFDEKKEKIDVLIEDFILKMIKNK